MTKKEFTIFGIDRHFDVISFVAELFKIDYYKAAKKIIVDFKLDINEINHYVIDETVVKNFEYKPKIELERGVIPKKILCYFDYEKFQNKPNTDEIKEIKRRIEKNKFKSYKCVEEIQAEILNRKTCIPSAIRGNVDVNWKKQQVFLIDFDNKKDDIDITIDNQNHTTIEKILVLCEREEILPTFIYNTFSHSENQHKFRLVYIFEEPIKDLNIARQIPRLLLNKLESLNPDISKKSLADMFFGGISICYKSDNYYKIKQEGDNENETTK